MSLWGAESEKKPVWLNEEEKENCYATKRGWTLKHKNGLEEVLVSIPNLDVRTGLPSLTNIVVAAKKFETGGKMNVKMVFNEKITLPEDYKLKIQLVEGDNTNNLELSIAKGNGSANVTFEHVVSESDKGEIVLPSPTLSGFDLKGFRFDLFPDEQSDFPIHTGILVNAAE